MELDSSVAVEEPLEAGAAAAEVLGAVGDQSSVLLTERQDRLAKFVKRDGALTCLVHPPEKHVDVVAAELAELQRVAQAILEVVVRDVAVGVRIEHAERVQQVEVRFEGQINLLTFNLPLQENDLFQNVRELLLLNAIEWCPSLRRHRAERLLSHLSFVLLAAL